MAERSGKVPTLQVLRYSHQLSKNKFFDLSTPSMRKDHSKKKNRKKSKIMTFIVATNVIASGPPQRRPTGTPTARATCYMLVLLCIRKTIVQNI